MADHVGVTIVGPRRPLDDEGEITITERVHVSEGTLAGALAV